MATLNIEPKNSKSVHMIWKSVPVAMLLIGNYFWNSTFCQLPFCFWNRNWSDGLACEFRTKLDIMSCRLHRMKCTLWSERNRAVEPHVSLGSADVRHSTEVLVNPSKLYSCCPGFLTLIKILILIIIKEN